MPRSSKELCRDWGSRLGGAVAGRQTVAQCNNLQEEGAWPLWGPPDGVKMGVPFWPGPVLGHGGIWGATFAELPWPGSTGSRGQHEWALPCH